MFERYVSIDWTGRAQEGSALAVARADLQCREARIERPLNSKGKPTNWTREKCINWLVEEILREDQPRCIVAIDFGFGYPWGADEAVFGAADWRGMLAEIGRLYAEEGTARAVAINVNRRPQFDGDGPYRFDRDRSNLRFHLDKEVAYYRLVELVVPGAISQWRLGSGATVGFSTITGMAALNYLISLRENERIDFQVWPQECGRPRDDKHLLVESYPAIYPEPDNGLWRNDDERDAWKALQWICNADRTNALSRAFEIPPLRLGRIEGVGFEEQIWSEGWILGVK